MKSPRSRQELTLLQIDEWITALCRRYKLPLRAKEDLLTLYFDSREIRRHEADRDQIRRDVRELHPKASLIDLVFARYLTLEDGRHAHAVRTKESIQRILVNRLPPHAANAVVARGLRDGLRWIRVASTPTK